MTRKEFLTIAGAQNDFLTKHLNNDIRLEVIYFEHVNKGQLLSKTQNKQHAQGSETTECNYMKFI